MDVKKEPNSFLEKLVRPKLKLSIVVPSISRDGGGFFHSVRNLAKSLDATNQITVKVLTSENNCPNEDYRAWLPIEPIECRSYGPYSFRYSPTLSKKLDATDADLVHLHGIWQHPSLVTDKWRKKWNRPSIISPRGMLDPWARSRSNWKKKLVERWFEHSNLTGASCIHSLCESETKAARGYGLKQPVCEVPNGVELPPYPNFELRGKRAIRNLLFLSRIHPKKGLLELIQGWSDWKHKNGDMSGWRLLVVGWDEIGYLETLTNECRRTGLTYRFFKESKDAVKELEVSTDCRDPIWFIGGAFGETKSQLLSSSDAFILPSYSEGLPISVLEAWSYGLPALITPQCNLPIGYEKEVALRIETSRDSISRTLDDLFGLSINRHLSIGEAARKLVESTFTWPIVANQMLEAYFWLSNPSLPKPDSIRTC